MDVKSNGQLLLADLHCSLIKAGFKPLLLNTDGVEFLIKKKDEDKYNEICNEWSKKTGLILDHDEYKRIAINNVNNYIGEFTNGSVKAKGLFRTERDWHEDPSFMVVPIALKEYLLNDIQPEDFIPKHGNIYDFCGRVKSQAGYQIEYHHIVNNKLVTDNLQKVNRVYISNKGGQLYKRKDDRLNSVYKGYKATVFNTYVNKNDYDINYSFYIREVRKIIDEVNPKQLGLF